MMTGCICELSVMNTDLFFVSSCWSSFSGKANHLFALLKSNSMLIIFAFGLLLKTNSILAIRIKNWKYVWKSPSVADVSDCQWCSFWTADILSQHHFSPLRLRWRDGCTPGADASHHSETPSTARCSLWSSRLVLRDLKELFRGWVNPFHLHQITGFAYRRAPPRRSSQTPSSFPREILSFVRPQPESASAQLRARRRRRRRRRN